MTESKRPEKGKGAGQWIGTGVFEFDGEIYRHGDEIPKTIDTAKLNSLKNAKQIGRIPEPMAVLPLDEKVAELEADNKALVKENTALTNTVETLTARVAELEAGKKELENILSMDTQGAAGPAGKNGKK